MNYADELVAPSLWEGFQTVTLEAMAKLIRVVATDMWRSCEFVVYRFMRLLVPTRQPDHIAAAIQLNELYPKKWRDS